MNYSPTFFIQYSRIISVINALNSESGTVSCNSDYGSELGYNYCIYNEQFAFIHAGFAASKEIKSLAILTLPCSVKKISNVYVPTIFGDTRVLDFDRNKIIGNFNAADKICINLIVPRK